MRTSFFFFFFCYWFPCNYHFSCIQFFFQELFTFILGICLYICMWSMCVQLPRRSGKDIRALETEVTDGCEPPCGFWEQNSDLLEELQVFLTPEPALQASADVLNHFDFITISFLHCAILWWLSVSLLLCFVCYILFFCISPLLPSLEYLPELHFNLPKEHLTTTSS